MHTCSKMTPVFLPQLKRYGYRVKVIREELESCGCVDSLWSVQEKLLCIRIVSPQKRLHPHLPSRTPRSHTTHTNTHSLLTTPSVSQPDSISPYNMFYFMSHQPTQPFFLSPGSSGCDQYLHTGTFCWSLKACFTS